MMHRALKTLLLAALTMVAAFASAQPEVVKWSAEVVQGDSKPGSDVVVELSAAIEKDWHLYALPPTKAANIPTTIEAVAPLVLTGAVEQPAPITKFDPNFEAETSYFADNVTFRVPLKLGPTGLEGAKLKVQYQACNATSCLPPMDVEVPIATPNASPVTWSVTVPEGVQPGADATVQLTAKIRNGWKLYALPPTEAANVPTTIEAVAPLKLAGDVTQPKPIHKMDENFGAEVDYFEKEVTFQVPVTVPESGMAGARLSVTYQACDATTCLPPTTLDVPLETSGSVAVAAAGGDSEPMDDQARVAQAKQQGLFAFMALAFGAGLLALLTPCVFPMVPITVSFFAKRRETAGSKGLLDAAAYCFGIIGAFTAFGLLVTALFGKTGIQDFATNPWVNLAIGVLFVALALNLFGFYQIGLPSGLANKLNPHGKAGLLAPILMGLTFTITSFTCTVPFVGTILVSAASGEWVYPFFGMLAFGTAFSLPFFLLALFPQFLSKLPKAGLWMEAVKGFMGFLELAAAVKFFSNSDLVWNTGILPRDRFLLVWLVIGAGALLFVLGVIKLPHVKLPREIGRSRAVVIGLTGLTLVWLGFGIRGTSLGELEAFLPPSKANGWVYSYEEGQRLARTTGKPMFINFTGVTCTNCRWMEKNMFPREDVASALKQFVMVELFTDRKIEADRNNQKLQFRLAGTVALPVYLVVSPEGEVIRKFESSTRDVDEFVSFLKSDKSSQVASK